jgi:hypothetical protein
MWYVKITKVGSVHHFKDVECPTESKRLSNAASQIGGAYYKKYLKYKNKYLQNSIKNI